MKSNSITPAGHALACIYVSARGVGGISFKGGGGNDSERAIDSYSFSYVRGFGGCPVVPSSCRPLGFWLVLVFSERTDLGFGGREPMS